MYRWWRILKTTVKILKSMEFQYPEITSATHTHICNILFAQNTLYIKHYEHNYFLLQIPRSRIARSKCRKKYYDFDRNQQIAYSIFLLIYIPPAVRFAISLKCCQHYLISFKIFSAQFSILKWRRCLLHTYLSKFISISNYLLNTLFAFFISI